MDDVLYVMAFEGDCWEEESDPTLQVMTFAWMSSISAWLGNIIRLESFS